MADSEIADSHTDSALTYEPAAGQRVCLWPNTEPILRNPTCWILRNLTRLEFHLSVILQRIRLRYGN